VWPAVQGLICGRLEPDWHGAYRRVARVLSGVVRARRVVDCLNSIVGRQPARHRTWSQAFLNRKRWPWNGRELAQGPRQEACPYQHLGLSLPTDDWWELLGMDPELLQRKVSTPLIAA
jgi:hypothetical protein